MNSARAPPLIQESPNTDTDRQETLNAAAKAKARSASLAAKASARIASLGTVKVPVIM